MNNIYEKNLITNEESRKFVDIENFTYWSKIWKNFTINSLNKFIKKYKQFLDTAYVIHTGDYRQEKILNIC